MEKSILDMVGGEKNINPHYDIKAESTGCKGFTGIEINGVRFSNISEMLRYMDKQKEQLTTAKEIIKTFLLIADNKVSELEFQLCVAEAKQFLKEVEK